MTSLVNSIKCLTKEVKIGKEKNEVKQKPTGTNKSSQQSYKRSTPNNNCISIC